MWIRKRKSSLRRKAEEAGGDVVDVVMEGMEEAKENVQNVFEELDEVIEEHVEETLSELEGVLGGVVEEEGIGMSEKKSFVRKGLDRGDELEQELRKLWRTLLYDINDADVAREYGRKVLDDLKWRYGMDDYSVYVAWKFVEGMAKAMEERVRRMPEIMRELKREHPWLFDDDEDEY